MLLSKIQEDMKNSILEFILNDNPKAPKFIRWNAVAGAGKTSTLKEMYKDYKEINSIDSNLNQDIIVRDRLFFTATTNPAVTLLNTVGCSNTSTIHKFLNLKLMRKEGNQYLHQVTSPNHDRNSIVVVDEASMICQTIFKYMAQSPYRYILVGDDQQFLAVGNHTGRVFKFNREIELNSTETFRFEDPKLSSYVRVLKQNVMDKKIESIPNHIGESLYCINDDVYFNTLKDAYTANSDNCLTITFSNKQVSKYENHIKSILGKSDEINTGDKLIFKSPIRQRMGYSIDLKGGKNLTEVKVIDCDDSYFIPKLLTKEDIPFIVVESLEHQYQTCYLIQEHNDLSRILRKLASQKSWNEYYKIKENVAIPNYGYASTAHGSQGLSIPYVFLDLTDIGHMANLVGKDTINRMIYVSISRASKNVFIRGEVPHWLIGNY